MIPAAVTFVPSFIIVSEIGWLNSYQGLIVPVMFQAFAAFLFRQYFLGFPLELEEAARIDGLSTWGTYWRIVVPNSKGIFAAVASITFIASWNAFLWPLVVGRDQEKWTVQVALSTFLNSQSPRMTQLFVASAIAILPLLVGFVLLQRYIVEGRRAHRHQRLISGRYGSFRSASHALAIRLGAWHNQASTMTSSSRHASACRGRRGARGSLGSRRSAGSSNQALERVGQQGLLHAFVGDAEHHDVVESLTSFRDRRRPGADRAWHPYSFPRTRNAGRPSGDRSRVVSGQGAGDLLDVLTAQHSPSVACDCQRARRRVGSAAWFCGVTCDRNGAFHSAERLLT